MWNRAFGTCSGQLAVMMFFLLSAFLMSYKYLDTPPPRQAVTSYAVARIARVMPLFLFVVLLSFAVHQCLPGTFDVFVYDIPNLNELASHLLLLHGTSVLWTIPPEIHFYILFACAWILGARAHIMLQNCSVQRRRIYCGIAAIAAILLALFIILRKGDPSEISFFGLVVSPNLKVFPFFAVGAVLGVLFRRWRPPAWLRNRYSILALLVISLFYPAMVMYISAQQHAMWADLGVLVSAGLFFFVVVFLLPEKNQLFENWAGDMLGRISYSLYILHIPLLLVLKDIGLAHGIGGLMIYLSLAFSVAYISFAGFELPVRQRLRTVFTTKLSPN
ncbi:MAG: acyltransferase [Gallionellaceae bacterium]